MRNTRKWLVGLALLALMSGLSTTQAQAKKLAEAELRIEINSTDGDAGVHVILDGEGWDTMQMKGPNGVEFSIAAENSVGFQGITEFFFESAEPSFDVQTLEELMELFPEGNYRFRGTTTEGKKLKGKATLTHDFPEGPMLLSPVDGEGVDPANAVFTWQAVADPPGSEIVGYEVIVGCEVPDFVDYAAQVGPGVTSVTVSPEILGQEGLDECKWEVLAVEQSANQTISETEFSVD